jgi:hypothetical protein
MGRLNAGDHEIPIVTEGFNPGVYFCKINVKINSAINTTTRKLPVD